MSILVIEVLIKTTFLSSAVCRFFGCSWTWIHWRWMWAFLTIRSMWIPTSLALYNLSMNIYNGYCVYLICSYYLRQNMNFKPKGKVLPYTQSMPLHLHSMDIFVHSKSIYQALQLHFRTCILFVWNYLKTK